jgi:tetratricopeptide (TPR) repeat protein
MPIGVSILMLAGRAHAADVELTILPPEPEWLVYPSLSPGPCTSAVGVRIEDCPLQLQYEGTATVGEQSLLIDLAPLLAARDYEAVLARVGMNYGLELPLLEAGDMDGFLATRMPTDGRELAPPPAPPPRTFRAAQPRARPMDTGEAPPTRPARTEANATGSQVINTRARLGPDTISAAVLYVIGHSYFSLGQYLPAETAFHLALRGVPNHVRAHESLGMLYLRTERYEDARVHWARAVELGRNTAHVHGAVGYLDQQTSRYSGAANAFQRALVLDPENRTAKRGLLHALTKTREHGKAQALVEQLLRDEPDDMDLWLYRAHIALAAGHHEPALASLETASRLGNDSLGNRRARVELHMESGNIARAVDLMRGSGARGLPFSLVDEALGWLANEAEWEAFRELSTAVDSSALGAVQRSRLLMRRASLALHGGNRRAASSGLQEALTLDPSNADALMALGQIYRAGRDYGRADLLFQRASAYTATRDDALVARAGVAIDQEDFDGALTILRTLVAGSPARADVRRNIDLLEDIVLLRTER